MTPTPPVPGPSEVFVDRVGELERLEAVLSRAVRGSGSVVLISGETGIGKTALAREFLRRARAAYPDLQYCRGRCLESYGTGEAYLPFLDGLGRILAGPRREYVTTLLQAYAPTWCLQLRATTPTPADREALHQRTLGATKERMLRELCEALEKAAGDAPLILILEDLHWADPSSIDLIHHVEKRIARQRLVLLGTYRPAELDSLNPPLKRLALDLQVRPDCPDLSLGPLPPSAVAEYLDARFVPHRIPPAVAEQLQAKTEGHPLFITSLVNFLCERGDIRHLGDHWGVTRRIWEKDVGTPESLRAVIHHRIEALGSDDRLALQGGSIIGREFLSTILADVLEVDELELEERLDRLARTHRLINGIGEEELPDGTLATRYRFANPVYADVLYEGILPKRRVAHHRRVAQHLEARYGAEATPIAVLLALHAENGRDFAGAVRYRVIAGLKASEVHAHAESCSHYIHALGLVPKLPTPEQAGHSISLLHNLGLSQSADGRFAEAAATFRRMLAMARASGSLESEFGALTGLCNALYFLRRMDEMAVRAEQAVVVAVQTGREALRVEALVLVAMILEDQGDLTEVGPLLDEAIQSARGLGLKAALLSSLIYRGALCCWQMDYEPALALLTEARGLASETRNVFNLLLCLLFLSAVQGHLGRLSEALGILEEAIEMARRNGDHFWLPRLLGDVAVHLRVLQDREGALDNDLKALAAAREHRVAGAEVSLLVNLASDHIEAGDLHEVPALLAQLDSMAGQALVGWVYDLRLAAAKAEYSLRTGDPAQAEEHARRLMERARGYGAEPYIVEAHRILAESLLRRGDPSGAAAALAEGLARLRGRSAPILAWRAYETLGRARAGAGDSASAEEAFAEAARLVSGIAAGVKDEALRARFLGGAPVRPAGPPPTLTRS